MLSKAAAGLFEARWNQYDQKGDALRSSAPITAGYYKKAKEHLGRITATTDYLEKAVQIIMQEKIVPEEGSAPRLCLRESPISEAWALEFRRRVIDLPFTEGDYVIDPNNGRGVICARKIAVELAALAVDQHLEVRPPRDGHVIATCLVAAPRERNRPRRRWRTWA